ncbi:hypothetical protein MMC22_004377 [Lobaria immixta]|nr:hypothetical protein [Lobaria immixta]
MVVERSVICFNPALERKSIVPVLTPERLLQLSLPGLFYVLISASGVFGWYLLGPLLGPTLGPLFGGLIVESLGWRWVFWILAILCTANTVIAFVFLKESYAPVILEKRKENLEKDTGDRYHVANEDPRPFWTKLASSMNRPLRILFTQPIVFVMAIYQAFIFGTNYSLFTNFQALYGNNYGFSSTQVGLVYLAPGVGFLLAVWLVIPRIDTIYNSLTDRNNDVAKPEFRLPLANIGSVFIPLSLFWLAWTVEYRAHWFVTILSTAFFGFGQVTIFNTVQNYFIDSFSQYAASAIAAGALFRSIIGGLLPLVAPSLIESVGYGWGISMFAFLNLALSPFPLLFYLYGEPLRMKFAIEL